MKKLRKGGFIEWGKGKGRRELEKRSVFGFEIENPRMLPRRIGLCLKRIRALLVPFGSKDPCIQKVRLELCKPSEASPVERR